MGKCAEVHHYQLPKRGRLSAQVPAGTKIVGAQWRPDGGPSVYVEKPFEGFIRDGEVLRIQRIEGTGFLVLEAFYVATGQEFELEEGLSFIQTVTPDGHHFFHVYARLV